MPSPRSTFVSPLLTNVYVAYKNDMFIADKLFPRVYVDKETGIYFVRDKENLRAPADARRGEFSRANRVTNTLSQATYTLEEKSLESPISERVMNNYADPFDPKRNAIGLVADKLALDRELDLQTTILASGAPSIDAGNAWSTITTDIVGQIRTGRNSIQKNTGKKPNTVAISKLSLDSLLKNTAFIASVQYTQIVNEQALRSAIAAYFDVQNVYIGEAVQNTAKEGQTDVMDYVWSDNCILMYVEPTPVLESTSAGYTLTQAAAAYADEWYEQETKTTYVRATDFYDAKVVDPYAMYAITNTTT